MIRAPILENIFQFRAKDSKERTRKRGLEREDSKERTRKRGLEREDSKKRNRKRGPKRDDSKITFNIGCRRNNWHIATWRQESTFFQTDYSRVPTTYLVPTQFSQCWWVPTVYTFFFLTALRHTLTLELLPGKSVNWGTIFAFISTHFM